MVRSLTASHFRNLALAAVFLLPGPAGAQAPSAAPDLFGPPPLRGVPADPGRPAPVAAWPPLPPTRGTPPETRDRQVAVFPPAVPAAPSAPPSAPEFELAETLARVGDQPIFRGELLGDANLILASIIERVPAEEFRHLAPQIDLQREELVRQLLKPAIDRKLMYLEFLRHIPSDKLKEVQANIDKRTSTALEESLDEMLKKIARATPAELADLSRQDPQLFRLAMIMNDKKLSSMLELDRTLRQYGSSLRKQQEIFVERMLGQQQMFKSINPQPEVTHDEMLEYYRQHQDEFRVPARARWEQLTARFNRFPNRDKELCRQAIAEMFNEVYYGGAPFWAVAQRRSHGAEAAQGGYHDWTEWGDLRNSPEINHAVFTLPVQRLSGVIEDSEGYHVIRVIERRESHLIPFTEAQVQIKKTLQQRKRSEAIGEYLARLRKATPVWTVYDTPETAGR